MVLKAINLYNGKLLIINRHLKTFGIIMNHTTMSIRQIDKYSLATRIFHWLGALLLLATWIAIEQGDEFIALHKSLGASFLLWTILRIANRFVSKAPAPVPAPAWQTAVAHITHLGLYVAMLALPITGVLMSMYGGRGVSIFGIVDIPAMLSPDRDMARFFNGVHTGMVFYVLVFLVVAHIGAALYHQFIIKDNLMARMK